MVVDHVVAYVRLIESAIYDEVHLLVPGTVITALCKVEVWVIKEAFKDE